MKFGLLFVEKFNVNQYPETMRLFFIEAEMMEKIYFKNFCLPVYRIVIS